MQKNLQVLIINSLNYLKAIDEKQKIWKTVYKDTLNDLRFYFCRVKADNPFLEKKLNNISKELDSCSTRRELDPAVDDIISDINRIPVFIQVDFIILRSSHWGAVKSLVDGFLKTDCHVRIVPTPMIQELQDDWGMRLRDLVLKDGYEEYVYDFNKYDIEEQLPDIVIDNMAVDCAKIPNYRFLRIAGVVDYVVHLEHSLLTGYTEAMKSAYFRIGRSRCWQYIVPSIYYVAALPLIFRIDGQYLPGGYPEVDTILHELYRIDNNGDEMEIILWNIDAMDPERILEEDIVRLDRELDYIERIATIFPEKTNIVRRHPNLNNQTKANKINRRLTEIIKIYDNVLEDKNDVIIDSYKNASVMVTWLSSTTALTFAATGKPVILLPAFLRNGYDTLMDMKLLSQFYIAYNLKDISMYIHLLSKGGDIKKKERVKCLQEYIGKFDGKIGSRIAQEVIRRYEYEQTC